MWVELATGVAFAMIFYLDVMANWHGIRFMAAARGQMFAAGVPPWQAIPLFLHHAILFSFLLAAALCDWDHRSIPMSLTVVGTIVGLVSATLFPWPFPDGPGIAANLQQPVVVGLGGELQKPNWAFQVKPGEVPLGLYPWPVWGPVPDWLWNHRWALGLLTGLAGAAAGMFMIRAVKFTFEKGLGREALGLGDADLMMMAGAFLGWQLVFVAFFVGAIVSLPVGIAFRLTKGERAFPFGPGLALGILITMLTWRWVGPVMQMYLFEEVLVLVAITVMAAGLFLGSIFVRVLGFGAGQPATAAAS
jgi:leader peptidase (prepilin peptidase)/N-methyltransferase